MTGIVDRRKFLRAAGVTAAGAAAAGVGGELLLGKQFRKAPPASMAPAAPSPSTAPPPKLEIDPMTPLPADETLDNIAGLSPFYTPNKEFYRVDTSLVMPKVSAGRLAAAHPRHGGPAGDSHLRRPASAAHDRPGHHPDLRIRGGGRQLHRQRPVAGHAARAHPAQGGHRTGARTRSSCATCTG